MAPLKQKGDLAELRVAADLVRRGHGVAIPWGEDADYDLVLDRDGLLERVQVKYGESDGAMLVVRCRSLVLTGGKVRAVKRYTARSIDWLAVFDATTDRCFYIPALALGDGQNTMTLRLTPARNGQRSGVRMAADFEALPLSRPPTA